MIMKTLTKIYILAISLCFIGAILLDLGIGWTGGISLFLGLCALLVGPFAGQLLDDK